MASSWVLKTSCQASWTRLGVNMARLSMLAGTFPSEFAAICSFAHEELLLSGWMLMSADTTGQATEARASRALHLT